jgi:AraC-like DNA-binding protein
VSNALPLSMNVNVPVAPSSRPRATFSLASMPANRPMPMGPRPVGPMMPMARPMMPLAPLCIPRPVQPPIPRTTAERMAVARERIRAAAEAGQRIRSYEVALDLDLSEFHFARQFRAAFDRSPHVFYDEVRADRARLYLCEGMAEGEVARRVGFRRPAELRALLSKRTTPAPASV